MKTETWQLLVANRVTTLIGVGLVIFLGTRWNTLGREEIVALIISALIHGISRDPKFRSNKDKETDDEFSEKSV